MRAAKRLIDFGELEGDRRSTGDSPKSIRNFQRDIPPTEICVNKRRRRFSKEFKLRILKEIDESTKPGQIGAILRREGLYSSNITTWREQMERGKLNKNWLINIRKKLQNCPSRTENCSGN